MLDSHLEQAFSLAMREVRKRRHEYFTLEHLLFGITSEENGRHLLDGVGIDIDALRCKLERFFEDNITPADSGRREVVQTLAVQRVMQRTVRHMNFSGKQQVGIGDVLASLLEEDGSYAAYFILSQGVTRLDILEFISADVDGAGAPFKNADAAEEGEEDAETKALKKYTMDLTDRAGRGEIDPLIGREREIERTLQILARRRKNNPLFVGDPGVGKTALAEGLAMRIVSGKVPGDFLGTKLYALDLGGMMAGAKYRGDFEGRLKAVISALGRIPKAVLFVDEIHTLVGAGSVSGGSLDASNILKPALGSGALRCIGSTTHEEMRSHFEKDKALARRFQKIDVGEPSREECLAILRGLKDRYERHHKVRYTVAALEAAVTLSARYLPDARLPDKAIDLIDEAGARHRLRGLSASRNGAAAQHEESGAPVATTAPSSACSGKSAKAAPGIVGAADIEQVVGSMARIPPVKAGAADKESLRHLERDLNQAVFGQSQAVGSVTRAVLRARAGFKREERPQGAFLFYGPTGVGKTELARQLALTLGTPFLRYDMSEYMEKHSVSRFIGAPPGYVGFDQGGLLIETVRKNPYAVLLLDEIEKAHPDVFNVLLQVMDYATLTDSSGRKADFRNIILIMTTNAGTIEMSSRNIGFGAAASGSVAVGKAKKALERLFTPEFRNRLDAMISFSSLSPEAMTRIVDKFTGELARNLLERNVSLTLTDAARSHLTAIGYDPIFGARPMTRVMRESLEDVLAGEILFGRLKAGGAVVVDAAPAASPKPAAGGQAPRESGSGLEFVFAYEPADPKTTRKLKAKRAAKKKKAEAPAESE